MADRDLGHLGWRVGDWYDYLSGPAVLRLSQYLTPAQAHAYEKAFAAAEH